MSSDFLSRFLADAANRQAVIDAVQRYGEQHPEEETVYGLKTALESGADFFSLSADQRQILQNVLEASPSFSLNSSAMRFGVSAPQLNFSPQHNFIARGAKDTLRKFIDANPELRIGTSVPLDERATYIADFERYTGINLASVKMWGEEHNGAIREPQNLEKALLVYQWLDNHARLQGKRIDIWDYLACIYKRVSKMLTRADLAGQIIVRVPSFMEGIPAENLSYQAFALAVKNQNLAGGIPDSTISQHARGRVERPSWGSMDRYADFISEQAMGDDDDINHRRDIFEFEVFIRLLPIIGKLVPAFDIANRPLTRDENGEFITSPLENYPTRFTLRLVPQQEIIEYRSAGISSKFDVRFWPFSNIANGYFDNLLDILDRRIKALEAFSYALNLSQEEIGNLKDKYNDLLEKHALYSINLSDLENASPSTRTQDYLKEVKNFYRQLDKFFKQVLIYTKVHGVLNVGEQFIQFKIVPNIQGVDIAPVVDGRVSVFADDIIQKVPSEQINNVFTLRVLTNWYVASGAAPENALFNKESIIKIAQNFGLDLSETELRDAAGQLASLNKAAQETTGLSIDLELKKAMHLGTTGMTTPRQYYIYDYASPWRANLLEHYAAQGISSETAANDTKIAHAYFKAVRHPHYIYNEAKLQAEILRIYESQSEQEAAQARLLDFFRHINVRIDSQPLHILSLDDTSPETKVIAWAVQDYLELFPGASDWGARVEINDRLLAEVVDRQIMEHPDVYLRRKNIIRGVLSALNGHNQNYTNTIAGITNEFYPLPPEGIFPQRFFNFMKEWATTGAGLRFGASIALRPPEVREKLLLAFSLIREASEDEYISYEIIDNALAQTGLEDELDSEVYSRFLFAWFSQLHYEIEVFKKLANPESIETYIREKYSQPVPTEIASRLILKYFERRLTTPQPVDLESLIAQEIELGNKYDFYPTIKEQVIAFYHKFIRDYIEDVYIATREKYESAMTTVSKIAENYVEERIAQAKDISQDDFLTRILTELGFIELQDDTAQIATASNGEKYEIEMKSTYHPSIKEIRDLDLQIAMLSEALGKKRPDITLLEHTAQTFNALAKKFDDLMNEQMTIMAEKQRELDDAERSVEVFWKRMEASLQEYLSLSYDTSNMGELEVNAALQNIDQGMALAAGFKNEMNGDVFATWETIVRLEEETFGNESTSELIFKMAEMIENTEKSLGQQKILLAVQWPLSRINSNYQVDEMDRTQISNTKSQIEMDLEHLDELERQVGDSIFNDWEDTKHRQEIIDEAKLLIAEKREQLEDIRILLDIRLDDIKLNENRAEADAQTRQIISKANRLLDKAEDITKEINEISENINNLREDLSSFALNNISNASQSVTAFQEISAKFEELRERADNLRTELDGMQTKLDNLNPGEINRQLANLPNKEILSDQARTDRTETRKKLASIIPTTRATLQQTEGYITKLGEELASIERQLLLAENNLPVPAAVEMPEVSQIPSSQMRNIPGSEYVVAFNTANFSAISRGRMHNARDGLSNLDLLVVNDKSYIIFGAIKYKIQNWMQDRSAELVIEDIFGTNINIESGFRGVNILDAEDERIPAGHLLHELKKKIDLLFITKSYELGFIIKLFEDSGKNLQVNTLLNKILACLAREPIETDSDVRLFVRRFALSHAEDLAQIRLFEKPIGTWFVKYANSPLHIETSDEDMAYYETAPLEELRIPLTLLAQRRGVEEVTDQIMQNFRDSLSPLFGSNLLYQLDQSQATMPQELALLWWQAGASSHHNRTLRQLFLYGLYDYLTGLNVSGGGELSLNETVRFAARFYDENHLELNYSPLLYDEKGKLIYTFEDHERLMEVYRWKMEHPDYQAILFNGQKIGPLNDGHVVLKLNDYTRLHEAFKSGAEKITIPSYNWKTMEFEDETVYLKDLNFFEQKSKKDPEKENARLLYNVFNNPHNLGVGYLINWVIRTFSGYQNAGQKAGVSLLQNKPFRVVTNLYEKLTALMEEYNGRINDDSSAEDIQATIDEFGEGVENLFINESYFTEENTQGSVQIPSFENIMIPVTSFEPDEEEIVDESVFLGQLESRHSTAAFTAIDNELAKNLPGWQNVHHEYKRRFIQAIIAQAQVSAGEQITMDSSAISYYIHTSRVTPVSSRLVRPFSFNNPFIGYRLAMVRATGPMRVR